jgi:GcrA cell cycle regulator
MVKWMAWSEQDLAVFQRLTDEGLTCSQIAVRASEELKTTLSRNVVIGLWNRAKVRRSEATKLRAAHRDDRDRGVKRERSLQERVARREARKQARAARAPRFERETVPPPTIDDMLIPAEQRRTIWTINATTCKWPVGDPGEPGFFFCGAEPYLGSSYCAGHRHRSTNYVRTPPFRRQANFRFAEAAE